MKRLPKLVISDIDGVMTDGGMYYTADGDVMKRFCVKDGWGVAFLRKLGIDVAIMTGENTEIVARRAAKLKIKLCFLGVKDKLALCRQLCGERGIDFGDVAFIGDDINDVPLLRAAAWSGCPANTPDYVARYARFRGKVHGGHGAFREFVETILEDAGVFGDVLDRTVADQISDR